MELLKAILFGIIEGITEWLPISSTGHMILLQDFIHLGVSEEFYSMFEVVIQLGAILSVVVLYFKNICPIGFNHTKNDKRNIYSLWGHILISSIPAAIIGLLLDDWLDQHLYNSFVVALMLIIYGIVFIIIENKKINPKVNDINKITIKDALLVGMFQLLALIPGTSRSGATIIGGLIIGLSRTVAAEYTFYLAIPVMFGASLLKLVKYILKVGFIFSNLELIILIISSFVAFIISILVIKFLMNYIKKHNFKIFGYYRIILGIILIVYFLLK